VIQTLEKVHAESPWAPVSHQDREMVARELEAIVSSHHFKGSKRYPALLKYVVEAALDHRAGDLKERTLGVEVFGRDPNYDTNADPVVRISAGEVRKRIAQFYHENGKLSNVQIELPLGSYVPEFLLRQANPVVGAAVEPDRQAAAERTAHTSRQSMRTIVIPLVALLLLAGAGFAYYYHLASESAAAATEKLWNPLLNTARPVLIVLGTTHPGTMRPETEETTFSDHVTSPYHHVSVPSAIALAHLAGVVEQQGKSYEVKEAQETSLTDLRSRSVVLVGAINNDWTMRLTKPLRLHFTFAENGVDHIVDAANPLQTDWVVASHEPYSSVTADYAIVARFHDPTTEGSVMVIAGLGPYGTEAAGEFVQSPRYVGQLANALPAGWENKNLELVIKTNVIGSKAGPPVLVLATTW
jgi:hypothetical protein